MSRRGARGLTTPRLEQLVTALSRHGDSPVTAIGSQQDGFDLGACGALADVEFFIQTVPVRTRR